MTEAPEKRGRGRPQTLDRERTVEIAMGCYWTDGVRNVSMNEVCRRADVSKPSLYREFGGEDGLMEAVVERYRDAVVARVIEALAADRPFADVLEDLLRWMTEPSSKPAGCLLAELRAAPGRLGPNTAAKVAAVAAELREAYERWFLRASARGEVDATVSPALATHFIDSQMNTVLLQMGLGGEPRMVREQAALAFRALTRAAAG